MPERSTRLSQIEIRSLYQAALGASSSGAGWLPPEPAQLAPFFPGYEIEALIARGGMGAVYRARQLSLGRTVAIKLLPFDLGVREDFAERFRREATALARLNHPHIVAIHDFGQADDGHYFMVMEHVEGSDLAARLRTGGPLPPTRRCASCGKFATRSTSRTGRAWCIATSNPRTSCSMPPGG